jgi:hypothetical protein
MWKCVRQCVEQMNRLASLGLSKRHQPARNPKKLSQCWVMRAGCNGLKIAEFSCLWFHMVWPGSEKMIQLITEPAQYM